MKTKSALLILLIIFALSCNQQSSKSDNNARAQSNALSSLSEREAQLIYSRAFEAILWASPALAVMAQAEAGRRDLGAGNHDIIYTAKSMDHRWGAPPPNQDVASFSTAFV